MKLIEITTIHKHRLALSIDVVFYLGVPTGSTVVSSAGNIKEIVRNSSAVDATEVVMK